MADPVVSALLLGKTAQAAERGVRLRITEGTDVTGLPVEQRDVVTILGNLIDNAIDAVVESEERVVEVMVERVGRTASCVHVDDSGPGVPGRRRRTRCSSAAGRPRPPTVPSAAASGWPSWCRPSASTTGRWPSPTSDLGGAFFSVRIDVPS